MKKLLSHLRPPHYMYLLVHLAVFLGGISIVQINGPVWIGCGSSLIAAGVTGWVVFVYIFLSQKTTNRIELLSRFGIKAAFGNRSIGIKEEYAERLQVAERHIDVLGFGLRALRQDFAKEFENWSRRVSVRILLIDPEYPSKTKPIADQRDREEGNPEKSIRMDAREFINTCKDLIKDKSIAFHVRLYTCLPSVNIFRIDDELFWGPYLVGDQSRNLPTFLVGDQGLLFKRLLEHFEQIWTNDELSRFVPADWLGD